MKIYAISDLHLSINNPKPMNIFGPAWENYLDSISESWKAKVNGDDVVLIAGDISWAMYLENALPDLKFISSFTGKKILLRGNHDYWWKSISAVRAALPADVYALQNDSVRFDGVVFCGSRGWSTPEGKCQTEEDKKIYDREIIRMRLSLEDAEKKREAGDKLIVMIHYPPFNSRFENTPFTELFEEFKADAVVYGHLHRGNSRAERCLHINGVDYFLTSCDMVENKLVDIAEIAVGTQSVKR